MSDYDSARTTVAIVLMLFIIVMLFISARKEHK